MIMRPTMRILALALGAACSTPTNAAPSEHDSRNAQILRDRDFDYLQPQTVFLPLHSYDDKASVSDFDKADDVLVKEYPEAFGYRFAARVYAIQRLETVMTTLEKRDRAYRLVSVTVPFGVPFDNGWLKPPRCEINLPLVLGDRLVALWQGVLQRTRYGKFDLNNRIGHRYIFNSSFMTGETSSPSPETVPGKLVAIVDEMVTTCEQKRSTAKLDAMSRALQAELVHYK